MSLNTSEMLRRYRSDIKRLTVPRLIDHGHADLVHVRDLTGTEASRADARTYRAMVAAVAAELADRGEESAAVRMRSYRHTALTARAVQWTRDDSNRAVPLALPPGYDIAAGLRPRRTAPKRTRG